jgi:hypothetical protein
MMSRQNVELDDERVVVVTRGTPISSSATPSSASPESHDQIASLISIREGQVVRMCDYKTKAGALAAASGAGDEI